MTRRTYKQEGKRKSKPNDSNLDDENGDEEEVPFPEELFAVSKCAIDELNITTLLDLGYGRKISVIKKFKTNNGKIWYEQTPMRYECYHCQQLYKFHSELKKHLVKTLAIGKTKMEWEKLGGYYLCPFCGVEHRYKATNKLLDHLTKQHTDEELD